MACHEDLSATDLVGRFLLKGEETVWQDGPLSRSVKEGSICYLDEIVEARKDSTVLIHSLTDHRRILPVEKLGLILDAHPDFLLVISYNPGYQNVLKDLKTSTRQRFVSIEFDYPNLEEEAAIIVHESGVDSGNAERLALVGQKVRNLHGHGFDEGVSTPAARLCRTANQSGCLPGTCLRCGDYQGSLGRHGGSARRCRTRGRDLSTRRMKDDIIREAALRLRAINRKTGDRFAEVCAGLGHLSPEQLSQFAEDAIAIADSGWRSFEPLNLLLDLGGRLNAERLIKVCRL